MGDTYTTRKSLLWLVKEQGNDEAWGEFTQLYQPFVKILIRKLTIPPSYTDDIAQEVIIEIWKHIERYEVGGVAKFRTWLMSVVRNQAYNYMRQVYSRQKRDNSYAEASTFSFEGITTNDQLEQIYQKEWEAYVCTVAFEAVKSKFIGNAIEVFQMTLDGCTLDQIKDKLDITVDTIYQLRHRVKSALVKEASRLRKKMEI